MDNNLPDGEQVLATRIPEGRTVDGLEYGRHVSAPGWSGYYVRPSGSPLPMMVARLTPTEDELPGGSTSRCDRCGEVVTDIDAGFSPGLHEMAHDCGGTWRFNDGAIVAAITEEMEHRRSEDPERYRFEHGSLYEYRPDRRAYVHVYRSATAKTKTQAIREYEGRRRSAE